LIEPYIPAWRLPWIEQMDEMAREFRARLDAMKKSKKQTCCAARRTLPIKNYGTLDANSGKVHTSRVSQLY
jgi:hypothetical protein